MKPFLGTDITTNAKNEQRNGDEFLVAVAPPSMVEAYERATEERIEIVRPQWGKKAIMVLFALAFLTTMGMALVSNRATQAGLVIIEQPLFIALMVLLALEIAAYLVLPHIFVRAGRAAENTDEAVSAANRLAQATAAIEQELAIPRDAGTMDVLAMNYKVKNGEVKYAEKTMQLYSHINMAFYVFTDSDTLCLANMECKYAIPRASLQGIRTVKQQVRLSQWNKDVPFNQGEYKAYRMNADQFGAIHAKPYYALMFTHEGEEWELYVPCYERATLETMTGLRVTEG